MDTPDEVVTHAPARCAGCGGGLGDAPVASTERRQVFDLPRVAPWVVEHRVEHRVCGCGRVTMAEVPAMRAAGVLPELQPDQVLVHDCWGPYWNFDVTHALCGAHLLREPTAAAEVDGQAARQRPFGGTCPRSDAPTMDREDFAGRRWLVSGWQWRVSDVLLVAFVAVAVPIGAGVTAVTH